MVKKNIVPPPLFIEVPVPDQGSEQSCIFVLGVLILLFIRIFYSILEVIWLCGMFFFFAVHFSITILLYDSISGKSIGLCNYIPSCLLNLSEYDQIIKKNKKKQHWIKEDQRGKIEGGVLQRATDVCQKCSEIEDGVPQRATHVLPKKHENKVFEFIKHSEATIPLFRWLTMSYSSRRNEK